MFARMFGKVTSSHRPSDRTPRRLVSRLFPSTGEHRSLMMRTAVSAVALYVTVFLVFLPLRNVLRESLPARLIAFAVVIGIALVLSACLMRAARPATVDLGVDGAAAARIAPPMSMSDPGFTAALLDRPVREAEIGQPARRWVRGKVVLITGAGGSIGAELARQVHSLGPRRLFLLDHDESALHAVAMDVVGNGLFADDSAVLCDVRDERAVREVMDRCRPQIVFHAAAHKHLPLLERYPAEGIKTNVFGTLNVVRAAAAVGVSHFVNVSTDKAAQPSSVLGATKRLAELVVTAHAGGSMRLASVRFGNVLGSRGSFLHSLSAQVARGVPVTVTDPQVTRFFMTIREAAGLVIEAAVLARSGETYVLDMGEPVLIVDLVQRYLELTGSSCAGITYTGLRPGEKLHEALFDAAEISHPTSHARITAVSQWHDQAVSTMTHLPMLRKALVGDDADELRARLLALLPDQSRTAGTPAVREHRPLEAVPVAV